MILMWMCIVFFFVAMSQTPSSNSGGIIVSACQASIVTPSTTSAHDPAIYKSSSHVVSSINTGPHTASSASMAHTQSSVSTGVQHSLPSLNPRTSSTGHVTPSTGSYATYIGPHPTPSTGPQATFIGPGNSQPATYISAITSSNTSGARPKNTTTANQALCNQINTHNAVPVDKLEFPEYCFAMNIDFKENISAALCIEHITIVSFVLSALLNTCGGLLALLNANNRASKIIDDWRNNLNKQMKCIPNWIYNTCISMPILNKNIRMFVKKSPRTITYSTHMFVRSPGGSSELANSDSVTSVLQIGAPGTYTPHYTTALFTNTTSFQYDDVLPPESMYIEYKLWNLNNTNDLFTRIKHTRNTKGLFALANNVSGGVYVIGVDDKFCQVKGLPMPRAFQAKVRARLTSWMIADDAGIPRIWGSEGRQPQEGADNDWEVTFIPVKNCPGGKVHYLIVIHMHHCPGGMFESVPECYRVNDAGSITALPFEQWKHRILTELDQNSTNVFFSQSATVSLLSPPVYQPSTYSSGVSVVGTSATMTRSMSTLAMPQTSVTLPSPTMTCPSPAVTLPSPAVTLPSPAVTLPSPAVTLPSPAVTLPSPAVTLPSPAVTLPSPAVTLPSPAVTLPSPAVTPSSPAVTLQSPVVTIPSPELSRGLATVLDTRNNQYRSASWTKCSNWNTFLTTAITYKPSLQGSQMREFQLSSPLALVPSKKQLTLSHPPKQVNAIVDALNNQYPDVPGLALTFSCLAEIFDLNQNIIPPIEHVLDSLILLKDFSLKVCSSFSNALRHNNRKQRQRQAYGFDVCRLIKKNILDTPKQITPHSAINMSIKPYIFTTDTHTLKSLRKSGDSLYEHYESFLGHMEGISLEMVHTRLANCTISKVVWLKNRIDNDITYHLTQQQCDAVLRFCDDRILMIEAAPGCGKSVMAAYICQSFGGSNKPGHVLYISPRKGFSAIVKHQGNADTYVAYDEGTLEQAIFVIKKPITRLLLLMTFRPCHVHSPSGISS